MHPIDRKWHNRFLSIWSYALLTVVLAAGFVGLDRLHASQTASTPATAAQQSGAVRGVIGKPPVCGAQLGFAGYSITLNPTSTAAQTVQTNLGVSSADIAPEFLPLTSSSPALAANSSAQALGLDRMRMVRRTALSSMNQSASLAKLQSTPGVAAAEPIWLQSSDKRYLACDYRLQDNTTDQTLAVIANQALIKADVSAATLNDTATMEFVSLRHFNGRQLLQVAFVRRVVGTPSVAYVALLDPNTQAVLATARANWYLWG